MRLFGASVAIGTTSLFNKSSYNPLQQQQLVNACALANFFSSYIQNTSCRYIAQALGKIKFPGIYFVITKDFGTYHVIITPSRPSALFVFSGADFGPLNVEDFLRNAHDEANIALFSVPFTKEILIDGLRTKAYKKVVFLTGAGISVAAGIPDFRTPGTGLYAQVAAYGLPKPEAIFSLDYFIEKPETFYGLAGSLMLHTAKPVYAHHFIKKVADEGQLLKCLTQNIDGLELVAGLDESLLVQAHGHMRSARCSVCRNPCPMETFMEHVHSKTVLRCSEDSCPGAVKPDVVFFGEPLPETFRNEVFTVKEADLVIIMGTSLKVAPFSLLLEIIPKTTPVVLLNREDVVGERSNFLFLPGDIEGTSIFIYTL